MKNVRQQAPSERTAIRQTPDRAHYDIQTIYDVVDQSIIATVAIAVDNEPFILPMAIARIGDNIYLHGLKTSRLMKHLRAGSEACVCIAHLDGIVIARSGMHCSANYRSVVIHGRGTEITGIEKADKLHQVVQRIIPGSEGDYRDHIPKELKATSLFAIPLAESACKIRTGGPVDDEEDIELPHWAGVIPVIHSYGEPIPSDDLAESIATPDYALHYARPGSERQF